jgi:hypothetical protein
MLASKSEDIRNLFLGFFIRPARQRTAMSRREAAMTAFAKSWWRE